MMELMLLIPPSFPCKQLGLTNKIKFAIVVYQRINMSSNSQIDELCKTTTEKDPDSQLGRLCACRQALLQNNELLNDYIEQSNYYTDAKAYYDQYLLDLSAHKRKRDEFEYKVKSLRAYGSCYWTHKTNDSDNQCRTEIVGSLLNGKGAWTIDSADDMGFHKGMVDRCSQGWCKSDDCSAGYRKPHCKLSGEKQKEWMDKWDAQFPPPGKASEPIRPGDLVLSDVLCCDQNFSDIKGDQVQFNNLIQDCQFKINKDIGRALLGEKFNVPSQPPIVKSSTSSIPPSSSMSSTSSTTWWESNKSWLIPVIVAGVIALCLFGYYAFGSMKQDDDGDDD